MRFLGVYCGSGPYRHTRRLLEDHRADWFPWGYKMPRQRILDLDLQAGDEMELWEVDDSRRPSAARPAVVGVVDYVSATDGYLALTLCRIDAPFQANERVVLDQLQGRHM